MEKELKIQADFGDEELLIGSFDEEAEIKFTIYDNTIHIAQIYLKPDQIEKIISHLKNQLEYIKTDEYTAKLK